MRIYTRLAVVLILALGASALTVVVDTARVQALGVPETLADRRPVQVGPVESEFSIGYLGVTWQSDPATERDDDAPGANGAVRFRSAGQWGPWIDLIEDGASAVGQWSSGLVTGGDADAYQVRGVPQGATTPQAVAINTTDGPLRKTGETYSATAGALTGCVSRAEWGAVEELRLDSDGAEVWPAKFYPVQTLTVHHTATSNNDSNPAATVRAIYRYHAVDLDWGDIGYQYLIDEDGLIYEGRWSGTQSTPCAGVAGGGGGDGSDFAHDAADGLVTAGHTGGFNSGNVGVALLGDFRKRGRQGGEPKAAAVAALTSTLTELADRHGLDPLGIVHYVNPANGVTRTVDTISGHRDWLATECPGKALFAMLPDIRQAVADGLVDTEAPTVTITSPGAGTDVRASVLVAATATDDSAVVQVSFDVDGTLIGLGVDGVDGWSTTWDTVTVSDGLYTITATATDDSGLTATDSVTVMVDNIADIPIHISDLAGSANLQGGTWSVTVTVTVTATVDDGGNVAFDGAEVDASWSTGGTSTCTTVGDGTCTLTSPNLRRKDASTVLTIDKLSATGATYDVVADINPEGNGASITVAKP